MPEVVRNAHGAEVCQRIKQAACENVPNHPEKGFHYIKAVCSRPLTLSISEGRKICPSCEKPPVVGNPQPRVTNAAGIVLTKKELEECGVTDDLPAQAPTPVLTGDVEKAVEAKVETKKDEVVVSIPLVELEAAARNDVAAYLIEKVIAGFGDLPVTNFRESKRLIQLEETLRKVLGA